MVELKQMANRPFSSISFIIERYDDNNSIKKVNIIYIIIKTQEVSLSLIKIIFDKLKSI